MDVETTGLEERDRLFQVAYIFGKREKESLFKPPVPISIESMETTGYTNKDVEGAEEFQDSDFYRELKEILEDEENILVAHNAKFDISFLEKEGLKVERFIDTFKLAQFLDPKGVLGAYRLQYLRYALDLEIEGEARAHDALGDVRVLKALFLRLFQRMKEDSGKSDAEILEEMMEISRRPLEVKKFSFGKYKGRFVREILMEDRGYLE